MKYRKSIEGMRVETLYNNVRKIGYESCDDYLAGLEIVSCDFRELCLQFNKTSGVVFIIDPPYLSTDTGAYSMHWRLADNLDVLSVLPGHNFIYFSSEKSCIIELCEWMARHSSLGDPFARCQKKELRATINYHARYKDIMLFTTPDLSGNAV